MREGDEEVRMITLSEWELIGLALLIFGIGVAAGIGLSLT